MTHSARLARARMMFLLILALVPAAARAQDTSAPAYKLAYTISMSQPASHLFEVQLDVQGTGDADHLDFQLPCWSPGRYAIFDFAKNVQEFRITQMGPTSGSVPRGGGKCENSERPLVRLDTQTWRVYSCRSPSVTVTYKVFADDLSGTFSQLDTRHASFNGGSVFVYVVGHKQDAATLKVQAPAGWKVINGRSTRPDQTEFSFPNYDELIDTPTEVAPDFTVQTFDVDGRTYRVVVHSFGDEGGNRGELVKAVEKIVRAEVAAMGAPEFEQYTFLFHFDPNARRGDGMEHLNSTQIVETGPLSDRGTLESAIGTASHEFFHVWNVKRLRPVGLGPWDFTRPVVTHGLWIAEGFTTYYGPLFERRAGLRDDEQLLKTFAGTITYIENSQGSKLTSAVELSVLAPFIDRATSDQHTNLQNTLVSYYPKGATLALPLDLIIRGRSKGKASLDEVMRRAYEEFYLKSPKDSYYLKGRGYTVDEFQRLASRVAGFDLSQFFDSHVYGTAPPPYDEALAYVGLRIVRTQEPRPPVANGVAASEPRTVYRIEKDDKASPEAVKLREAWLKGR